MEREREKERKREREREREGERDNSLIQDVERYGCVYETGAEVQES